MTIKLHTLIPVTLELNEIQVRGAFEIHLDRLCASRTDSPVRKAALQLRNDLREVQKEETRLRKHRSAKSVEKE